VAERVVASRCAAGCRTWESNNIGATPGFNGDVEKALWSIRVPFLYMPSVTDLYFPIGDAEYEKGFMAAVVFKPIPSLWGHTAGAAPDPEDGSFLNDNIGAFLAGR
jgi:homoserine O-acetyltransferase/O-succinyltransferase